MTIPSSGPDSLRMALSFRPGRSYALFASNSLSLSDQNAERIQNSNRKLRSGILSLIVFIFASGLPVSGAPSETASVRRGAVATVHPLASEAALKAFQDGGNAIDAAVAAALMLGVVDGHNSGIGGGCFMLMRLADGSFLALDGREKAPASSSRDMFLRDGRTDSKLSQTGPLAAGVPGALAVYDYAVRHHGKLSLKDLLLPAARVAEQGFGIDRHYARRLESMANDFRLFAASRAIFLKADGSALKEGELLKQLDLAGTYRAVAGHGKDWFYRGPFAEAAGKWMRDNGGLITRKDFEEYQIRLREPVRTMYRGHQIVGFPPPSSGGVHVAQILNILESFDLKTMGVDTADFVHVVTEAMKLVFADRAHWLGDPDFVQVPRGLVSKEYGSMLAQRIRPDRASEVPQHAVPPNSTSDIFGKHTTHFSTADLEGNWVACTATLNTTFGSKVVVPGTGVMLNNQMDDFSAQPGVANYFGLVGAEANAVAPGKRPLSSMSPTIVLQEGRPILSVGAAGGPTIISQTVLAIIHVIDFGLDPKAALARPRFHHQWRPDELIVESTFPEAVRHELERRGHRLKVVNSMGAAQAVGRDRSGQGFIEVRDPRVESGAASW